MRDRTRTAPTEWGSRPFLVNYATCLSCTQNLYGISCQALGFLVRERYNDALDISPNFKELMTAPGARLTLIQGRALISVQRNIRNVLEVSRGMMRNGGMENLGSPVTLV